MHVYICAYQQDETCGSSLVLGSLGIAQDAFVGFLRPCSVVVSLLVFLCLQVRLGGFLGQRLVGEPEEVLHETELPGIVRKK